MPKTYFNKTPEPKVVIIGAGVCGLGIGWQLAKEGTSVTILEKSELEEARPGLPLAC